MKTLLSVLFFGLSLTHAPLFYHQAHGRKYVAGPTAELRHYHQGALGSADYGKGAGEETVFVVQLPIS